MIYKATPQSINKVQKAGSPHKPSAVTGGVVVSESAMALNQIAALEERVAKLERVITVNSDGSVFISTSGKLVLAADKRLVISGSEGVTVQCAANVMDLSMNRISMGSSSTLEIAASTIKLEAGTIQADTSMMRNSGVIKCDTIIANSVVGSSYTPGAGNIW